MTPKEIRLSDVFHVSGPMFVVSGAVGNPESKRPLPLQRVSPDSPPFSPQLLKMAYNDIEYICLGLIRYASTDSNRHNLFYPLATYPRW